MSLEEEFEQDVDAMNAAIQSDLQSMSDLDLSAFQIKACDIATKWRMICDAATQEIINRQPPE